MPARRPFLSLLGLELRQPPAVTKRVRLVLPARTLAALESLNRSPYASLHARLASVAPTPKALSQAKARQTALVAAVRKRRTATKLQALTSYDLRLARAKAKVEARWKTKPRRSPDAILQRWVAVARPSKGQKGATYFILQTDPVKGKSLARTLSQALGTTVTTVGTGFSLQPLFRQRYTDTLFVLRAPIAPSTFGRDAYAFAQALKAKAELRSALPARQRLALFQGRTVDTNTTTSPNVQWHLDELRVRRAWAIPPPPGGRSQGAGAVIAHPDTGWRTHSQYDESQIDKARSANVLTETLGIGPGTAIHGIPGRDSMFVSHGTATGGIMVSQDDTLPTNTGFARPEPTPPGEGPTFGKNITRAKLNICGVAPKAQIVPIKFIDDDDPLGVARLNDAALARAIDYAASLPADVISLSVGGVAHPAVEVAINDAIAKGVIVVAASGQSYGAVNVLSPDDTVIEPAAFRDVIAVAASTIRSRPWDDSHYGPNIDITAPGHGIWIADFTTDGTGTEAIRCGEGTSFSAALTAAAAANWVAFWGRENLRQRYPNTPLAWVFRQVLQSSARRPAGWDTAHFGPGILDLEALLRTPLPAASAVRRPPATRPSTITAVGELVRDFNDGQIIFEDVLADAGAVGNAFGRAGAVLAHRAADATTAFFTDAYARLETALTDATGTLKTELERGKAALEQGWEEATEAATEAAETAADAGEDAVDALVELATTATDAAADAGEAVLDWLFG